jgi:hypothetical protein
MWNFVFFARRPHITPNPPTPYYQKKIPAENVCILPNNQYHMLTLGSPPGDFGGLSHPKGYIYHILNHVEQNGYLKSFIK